MPQRPKLTPDLLVRKESVPDSAKPGPAASGARINVTYRPLESVHERMRAASYAMRRPIQSIIDDAVVAWLDEHPIDGLTDGSDD